MSAAEHDVLAAVDARFPEAIAFLGELVRLPSPLGQVRPAQEALYRRLRQLGFDARMDELDLDALVGHPSYAPVTWSQAGQPNVWGIVRGSGGGRSLVLNGHIDVVPSAPDDWWTYDPWGATISGDRMYGRGALDMKSGLVAGLLAIQAISDAGIKLRGDLIFESVIEEECTGNGMLAQRLATGPVDGAVILEPTGRGTWMATPGVLWFEVTVRGKAAYVGRASDYVNAVETAAALIGRLKPAAVQALNAAFDDPRFAHLENPLTLNVGVIEGGHWPSSVPLTCRFTCRMSYPIGWSFADARRFVEDQVRLAAAADPWLTDQPPDVRFPGFRATPWEGDPDAELLRLIGRAHVVETGQALARTVFPGTADARYFDAGTPVVYYGPSGGGIHGPDEYVELPSVRETARTLTRLILEWCR